MALRLSLLFTELFLAEDIEMGDLEHEDTDHDEEGSHDTEVYNDTAQVALKGQSKKNLTREVVYYIL